MIVPVNLREPEPSKPCSKLERLEASRVKSALSAAVVPEKDGALLEPTGEELPDATDPPLRLSV